MHFVKAISNIVLCYLGCIIVFDLAAVLLVTLLPEPGSRRLNGSAGFGSVLLYYVVWVVAGCIAGAIYSAASAESTKENKLMGKLPALVFVFALFFSVALILLFYALGEMQVPLHNNDFYVPGHKYMTYTYFISFLAICLFNVWGLKKEISV